MRRSLSRTRRRTATRQACSRRVAGAGGARWGGRGRGGAGRDGRAGAGGGRVGVNGGVPVPREPFSFGGWNESKFGVGDITGRGSIEFWTQSKKMTTKWNKEAGTNWMS